jgi:putative holliday junction resolvase
VGSRPEPGAQRGHETLLAFDFGTRRIGVAVGNSLTGSARALATVDERSDERRFAAIAALIEQWRPDRLVVGHPTDEDGSETRTTKRAMRFANRLRGRFGLPVESVDERFSSREAQAIIAGAGGSRDDEDGVAAEVILQQYLDETAQGRSADDAARSRSDEPDGDSGMSDGRGGPAE